MTNNYRICEVNWNEQHTLLRQIRYQVFVCELRVNPRTEFDKQDPDAWHVLALDNSNTPIGTGRLSRRGEIGRIAVLINYRDMGIGSAIARSLIKLAQFHQLDDVSLTPELTWVKQFVACQACPVGPVFMDSGIPHQQLICHSKNVCLPDVPYLH